MSWESVVNDKLKKYQYKAKAKEDVTNLLRHYNDLTPVEDQFVFPNGARQLLLTLKGTIPVNYKGSKYNIPIQVWLFNNHPYAAPMVYVKPTSSMVIKPNKHVDQTGRVYLPYLNQWKAPQSDLYTLVQMLSIIFGEECPVYAKPTHNPMTSQPPYGGGHHSGGHAMHGAGYPTHGGGMPMPYQQQQQPGYHQQQQPYPSTNISNMTPYPTNPSNTPYPVSSSYQTQSQTNQPSPNIRQDSVIKDDLIRASLLSTAEDKLKQRIRQVFQMGKIELDSLQSTKFELEKGHRDLQEIVTRMKDEKSNLSSNISLLKQKTTEVDDILTKIDSDSDNLNIDEAVVTTAPLYNQILTLFAEESAVEDAIYYLSDALRREVVELDTYLKTIRTLSRRQFMLRATLQKARTIAGLSSDVIP